MKTFHLSHLDGRWTLTRGGEPKPVFSLNGSAKEALDRAVTFALKEAGSLRLCHTLPRSGEERRAGNDAAAF